MILFLVLITAVKLALAAVLGGTADIPQQLQQAEAFLAGRDVLDPRNTGNNPSSFLLGHYFLATAALYVARATATPFAFWIKTPAILADLGVSLLLRRIPQAGGRAAVTYMANPVTFLLSSYHGQPHTVATAAAMLALWLALRERSLLAGLVLGLATSVRQHFAMLIVPVALRLARDRALALLVFASVLFALNAPLLASAHRTRLLAPSWPYGIWGYSIPLLQGPRVLAMAGFGGGDSLAAINRMVVTYGSGVFLVWAFVFAVWVWRRPVVDLWHAALLFIVGFYALAPGFGVQGLVWALPFWLVVNYRGAVIYSALAGSFLAGIYWVWQFNARYGVASVTANLGVLSRTDLFLYLLVGGLGFVTWAYCVRSAWKLARR
jgi:hypothetical protein